MNRHFAITCAACGVGLLALASSAVASHTPTVHPGVLNYFDAQIFDGVQQTKAGEVPVPANTTFRDGTPFSQFPVGPDAFSADPSVTADTDPNGNWANGGGGSQLGEDGLWRRRFSDNFGNRNPALAAPANVGDILEARGSATSAAGSNNEMAGVLKTTINVPAEHQGQLRSVWVNFWSDTGQWQVAACLDCADANPDFMPVFRAGQVPRGLTGPNGGTQAGGNDAGFDTEHIGYVYQVYDFGDPDFHHAASGNDKDFIALMTADRTTTTDMRSAGQNRALYAGFLGDVVLGSTLSVYVWHGPDIRHQQEASGNFRTWYDGISIGTEPLGLASLPIIPEPASAVLLAIALASLGLTRRRTR